MLDAFVFYKGPGGPIEELGNTSYWVNVMKTVDYVAETAVGDAILVSYLPYIPASKTRDTESLCAPRFTVCT